MQTNWNKALQFYANCMAREEFTILDIPLIREEICDDKAFLIDILMEILRRRHLI